VVSKLTGFQDSEPGVGFGLFGAVTWAGRRCRRLSWVHRPRTTGPARVWRSRRKRRVGAARSRRRGHGPARLDGQAPLATVAGLV